MFYLSKSQLILLVLLGLQIEAQRIILTTYVDPSFEYNGTKYFTGGSEIQMSCATRNDESGKLVLYRKEINEEFKVLKTADEFEEHKEVGWTAPKLDGDILAIRCCFEKSMDTQISTNCSEINLGGAPIASISKLSLLGNPNSTDLSSVAENEPLYLTCSAPYIPKAKIFWRVRGQLMTNRMISDKGIGHFYNMNTTLVGNKPNEFSCQLFLDDIVVSEKKFILTAKKEDPKPSIWLHGAVVVLAVIILFRIIFCCLCSKKTRKRGNRSKEVKIPIRYTPADEEDPYAAESD